MKKVMRTAVILVLIASMMLTVGCGSKKSDSKGLSAKKKTIVEKYEKGILTSNSFKSKTLNMQFDLPDDYVMATEDELKKMMQSVCQITYKDNQDGKSNDLRS